METRNRDSEKQGILYKSSDFDRGSFFPNTVFHGIEYGIVYLNGQYTKKVV